MAVDWMDGCAHYANIVNAEPYASYQLLQKWTTNYDNSNSIVAGAGPRGNQVISLGDGLGLTRGHQQEFIWGWRLYVGPVFGINHTNIYTANHVSTPLAILATETDATLSLYSGSQTLIANTGSLNPPFKLQTFTWYYVEVSVQVNGGTPVSVTMTLRVNGIELINGAGSVNGVNQNQLLLQTPTANFHQFSGAAAGGVTYACDFLFTRVDGTGLINTFAGDVEISAVFPNQDETTQWNSTGTPDYSQVNPVFPPYLESAYISSNSVGNVEDFLFQPIQPFQGEIIAIHYLPYARKDNEGTRTFCLTMNGTQIPDSPTFSPSDEYLYYTYCMDAVPNSGGGETPWTTDIFNTTKFGVQILS